MRSLLASLIAGQGYTVAAALEDGAQLLETIESTKPDLICLDYELPGRNGLDLLAEINSRYPQIDVVMITGSDDPSVKRRAADAGAAGFIQKPFGQSQILDELEQIWATRQKVSAANLRPEEVPAELPAADQAGPLVADPARADRKTVVIVDDNGAIRLLLKGIMGELGFKIVQLVGNGAEAVAAAKTHQPDVLCLDVDMPVMTGLEALPLILAASPLTRIVMITANASRNFVQTAVAGGARGYILKPVRPAYVEAFMKKLFQ